MLDFTGLAVQREMEGRFASGVGSVDIGSQGDQSPRWLHQHMLRGIVQCEPRGRPLEHQSGVALQQGERSIAVVVLKRHQQRGDTVVVWGCHVSFVPHQSAYGLDISVLGSSMESAVSSGVKPRVGKVRIDRCPLL